MKKFKTQIILTGLSLVAVSMLGMSPSKLSTAITEKINNSVGVTEVQPMFNNFQEQILPTPVE